MPRRVFDKNATTFQLVHRAQNDPLIHDSDAPSMVFTEKASRHVPRDDEQPSSSAASVISATSYKSNKSRIRQRKDLEEEFNYKVRANEGEAAEHGVFFDDSKYDYMQHLRETGQSGATWVEAKPAVTKGKQNLEDALRGLDLDTQSVGQSSTTSSVARSLLPEEMLPSEFVQKRSYQDQQEVPDDIAGFQPDMDPRLREVLEALEDEAYVEDEEDIFAELTADPLEVERDEWDRLGEQQMFDEEELDEGWESDNTVKAEPVTTNLVDPPTDALAQPPADPTEGEWIDEFKKFKSDTAKPHQTPSALDASVLSSLASGRRKKRKGAKTSTSNYSMSSSALVRTDQQTLLDARFDKIEEAYAADEMDDDFDDLNSQASGMTGMSKASKVSHYSNVSGLSGMSGMSSYSRATDSEAPQLERTDFNSIMDEFLGGHSTAGRRGRTVKKFGKQSGMEQLDEVRKGLGPARIKRTVKGS